MYRGDNKASSPPVGTQRGKSVPSSSSRNSLLSRGVASVTIRVRCEKLSHGEEVYLVPDRASSEIRGIPLFTTARLHPWYTFRVPVSLNLPDAESISRTAATAPSDTNYVYRYAIYREGVFHRWEDLSDGPSDIEIFHSRSSDSADPQQQPHSLSLSVLSPNESYMVSDVLGVTTGPPNIEHTTLTTQKLTNASTLLHREGSSSAISTRSLASMSGPGTANKKNISYSSLEQPKKQVTFNATSSPSQPASSFESQRSVQLASSDGLVVASVFLPVHLKRSARGKWSAEWDYEALLSMQTHLRVTRIGTVKWRGWHGNWGTNDASPENGVPVEERKEVEKCLMAFNCVPVWCDTVKFGEMYNGFCKGVLWPILHNVTSVYSSIPEGGGSEGAGPLPASSTHSSTPSSYETTHDYSDFSEYTMDDVAFPIHGDGGREATLWSAYTEINRQFATTIIEHFNEGDLIWIHGFHLIILPSLLTRHIPMAKIGIFLHTPFPSSEIFRTLWCREDLLRGMLNADQVGFHLYEYARHFLTACRRLLGLNYGMIPDSYGGHNLAIEVNGRYVTVTSIHAGVESPVCCKVLREKETMEKATSIQNQFPNKVIFCAIDRMESFKGIPLKLLGLERFLIRCPHWVGKITFIQVGISAPERGDDYAKTKKEVLALTANINRVWPGTVQFQECAESEMRLMERMALLRAVDVMLVTPLRDGLNLVPMEFTIAHQDALAENARKDGRKRGICILSEFSSATRVMRGALHINPWKISEIANAFHESLVMSDDERLRRLRTASEFVARVTTQRWALAVMLDLKAVQKNSTAGYAGAGLGLGFRLLGMDAGFDSLEVKDVAKGYKNARNRLILLDYGGTILKNDNVNAFERYQMVNKLRAPSVPTNELILILKQLCDDTRNTVFVVSGKEKHSISKTLGSIPNLGLAAEHGMFVSWPSSKSSTRRKWETIVPNQDQTWRSIAISIMEVYTSRTHGSYIEETEMKILWQYRDADPEFGFLQSKELEDHLSNVLRGFSVDVLHGGVEEGGFVEVRPKGVNKGVVSMYIINNHHAFLHKKLDFILAMGDDHCDEPMLSVIRSLGRRVDETNAAKAGSPPPPPLPATVTMVDVSTCDEFVSPKLEFFTCTVGKKPSAAKNYLNDVDDVHELLDSLRKLADREKNIQSMVDLRSLSDTYSNVVFDEAKLQFMTGQTNSETMCAGVTRTMSMNNFKTSNSLSDAFSSRGGRVSSNLTEYMVTIDQDDEEEGICF